MTAVVVGSGALLALWRIGESPLSGSRGINQDLDRDRNQTGTTLGCASLRSPSSPREKDPNQWCPRNEAFWTEMAISAIAAHVDAEPLHERDKELIAVIAIDAQITKERGARGDRFRRTKHLRSDKSDDFFFEGNGGHGDCSFG